MYFLIKNLEEIDTILLNQCVGQYGCNCEKCPYSNGNPNFDNCDAVVEFRANYKKLKKFLEKYEKNILTNFEQK